MTTYGVILTVICSFVFTVAVLEAAVAKTWQQAAVLVMLYCIYGRIVESDMGRK